MGGNPQVGGSTSVTKKFVKVVQCLLFKKVNLKDGKKEFKGRLFVFDYRVNMELFLRACHDEQGLRVN